MREITEETLEGEWFYLEDGEQLDVVRTPFWTLREGFVLDGASERSVGSYVIKGDVVRIMLDPAGQATRHQVVAQAGPHLDVLSSVTTMWFENEDSLEIPSNLFRRTANYRAAPPAMGPFG